MAAAGRPPLIAVCCPSRPRPSDLEAARRVGELLAQRGAVLLCGGLGGAMAAAAAGAREAGGRVVGLLPGSDPGAADPGVELALATGLGEMRNALLLRAAQAVIAIGGGVGTLSEIALALVLGKPIAGLDTWGLEPPSGSPGAALQLERVPSPERAVEWVLGRAGLGQGE